MSDTEEECVDPGVVRNLADSGLQFTLDLYKHHAINDTGNIFFSPFSVSVALAMTFAGARNDTANQIREALKLDLVGEDPDVHSSFAAVLSSLGRLEQCGVSLNTANRMYVNNEASVLPEYQEILEGQYVSTVVAADFAEDAENIREEINSWVEETTNEKIRNLLEEGSVSEATRLILINAIYFKGDWANKFDPDSTDPGPFFLSAEEEISCDIMRLTGKFSLGYGEDLQCSILELPYVNGCLSMFIILPNEIDGIGELEEKLNADNLKELLDEMDVATVSVSLPKFRMECDLPAKELLTDIGVADLFTEGTADLSGISEEELYVSAFVHKAVCEVNEEGTEAAAATAVVMSTRCLILPIEFTANHPFIFFIRENSSGAILFVGKLANPEIAD